MAPAKGLSSGKGLVRRVAARHGAHLRHADVRAVAQAHGSNTEISPQEPNENPRSTGFRLPYGRVRGLAINDFDGAGILLAGGCTVLDSNDLGVFETPFGIGVLSNRYGVEVYKITCDCAPRASAAAPDACTRLGLAVQIGAGTIPAHR
jgi:hypothetical protein